jgi:predicted ester cyclase
MAPEELKARARRIADELLTQGDLAVADEVLAPDIVHHAPDPRATGLEGAKRFVRELRRAFPDLCAIVEDEVAEGDKVVQRITCSGTHEGEYLGLSPTGKRATWQVIGIQRMGAEGKFVEHWSTADLLGVLLQLGAVPAAAGAPRG